jgi:hypothetical protein
LAREEVESSNIREIGYDTDTQTLEILFKSGGLYQYFNIPGGVYEQLMGASSKGSFFYHNIRGEYQWRKVGG